MKSKSTEKGIFGGKNKDANDGQKLFKMLNAEQVFN